VTPGQVFVSYSLPDRETADAIVAHLEGAGTGCWVAPRDVAPGADWAAAIIDAIAAARLMVLVFSASANRSPQVRREVERAVHRGVTVVPFRIEDVLPERSLEYFLSTQHWLDAFPPPMEPYYARLLRYVQDLPTVGAATAGTSSAGATIPGATIPATMPGAPPPSAATLQLLEAELARYIGPVARHLVNRAARRTTGTEALIEALGAEIESQVERREFLQAARVSLHAGR
jgi:hypothetical protein